MSRKILTPLAVLALTILLNPGPATAQNPAANALIIVNSGSTNMAGYQIEVLPNGEVAYAQGASIQSASLPAALTAKVFADVRAATPLAQIGLTPCMKSASFGSQTIVKFNNETSPDISCGADAKGAALYADVQAIRQAAGVNVLPRRQFPAPFTPQKK